MPLTSTAPPPVRLIPPQDLSVNRFSLEIYGDPATEIDDLLESVRTHGVLVPLVICATRAGWEVLSGHRRLACARALGLTEVPCEIREIQGEAARGARFWNITVSVARRSVN